MENTTPYERTTIPVETKKFINQHNIFSHAKIEDIAITNVKQKNMHQNKPKYVYVEDKELTKDILIVKKESKRRSIQQEDFDKKTKQIEVTISNGQTTKKFTARRG